MNDKSTENYVIYMPTWNINIICHEVIYYKVANLQMLHIYP